jgi:photosystem II stability/assembly factor-like uncharacterized protein
MHHRILILIPFLCSLLNLHAQITYDNFQIDVINPSYAPTRFLAADACKTNENLILAASENGYFAKSTDKGATWQFYFVGYYGVRVDYATPDTVFMAVENISMSSVIMSTDGGTTWVDLFQQAGFSAPNGVFEVKYRGNGEIWAGGRNGSVMKSIDFGASWTVVQNVNSTYGTINSFGFFDNGFAMATTGNGRIMRSFNNFQTVSSINIPGLVSFTGSCDMVKLGNNYLTSYRGVIYWSTDQGLTWAAHPNTGTTGNSTLFNSRIQIKPDSVLVYTGSRIYLSTDNGLTFSTLQNSVNNFTNQLGASLSELIVLDDGVIYSFLLANYTRYNLSTNSFSNLVTQKFNAHDMMSYIHFSDTLNGVLGYRIYPDNQLSSNRAIVESMDGGLSWDLSGVANSGLGNSSNGGIRDYHFINKQVGFGIPPFAAPHKIVNGGKNWIPLPNLPSGSKIFALDEDNIFVISGATLFISNDGGMSASSIPTGISGTINDLAFWDINNGIIVGNNGTYRTTNGGVSWSQVNNLNMHLTLPFGQSGMIIGGSQAIRVTFDQGSTWSEIPTQTSLFMSSMFFNHGHMVDDLRGVIRSSIFLYVTYDGWQTYQKIYVPYRGLTGVVEMLDDGSIIYATENTVFKIRPIDPAPELTVELLNKTPICPGEAFSFAIDFEHIAAPVEVEAVFANSNDTLDVMSFTDFISGSIIQFTSPNNLVGNQLVPHTVTVNVGNNSLSEVIAVELAPKPDVVQIDYIDNELITIPSTPVDWYLNGDLVSFVPSISFTPSSGGNYFVNYSNGWGCISDNSTSLNLILSNTAQVELIDVSLFPIPTSDFLFIKSSSNSGENWLYRIFDLSGRKLSEGEVSSGAPIDVRKLDSGIYSIQFMIGVDLVSMRFVKF